MTRAPNGPSTVRPLGPTLRGAFETIAASPRLSDATSAEALRAFDHGRSDQIETWAERLDGDPLGNSDGRGTGHARGLASDVREAIAESRSLRDAARRRHAA